MINERLQELYAAQGRSDFIACGVCDEGAYALSRPRIVFLMREVNSQDLNWTMPAFLKRQVKRGLANGRIYRTWKPVGMWSFGAQHGFPPYPEVRPKPVIAEGLKAIGMTNLKKSRGKNAANYGAIKRHAREDLQLWTQELKVMNPDVVVCCGIFGLVASLLGIKAERLCSGRLREYRYALWSVDSQNMVLVDFYHPAARLKWGDLYHDFAEVGRQLEAQGFW